MSDIFNAAGTVVRFSVELGGSLSRLLQALGKFNYQLVATVFGALSEGCKAVFTVFIVLGTACADIVVYLVDLTAEIFSFLWQLIKFFSKFGVLVFEGGCIIWEGCECTAKYISQILLRSFRVSYHFCEDLLTYFGVNSANIKYGASWCSSKMANISSALCAGTASTFVFVQSAVIHLFSQIIASLYFHFTNLSPFTSIRGAAHDVSEYICSSTTRYWDVLQSYTTISTNYIIHVACDIPLEIWYALMLLSFIQIISWTVFYPFMKKRGLTLPLLWQDNHNESLLVRHRTYHAEFSDTETENISDTDSSTSVDRNSSSENGDDRSESGSSESEDREDGSFVSDLSELELASDESESEGDENNQNAINIQLPHRIGHYGLRARPSPSPLPSSTKMSPSQLEKVLENERDRRMCVVCQEHTKNVLLLPCRHMCMCVDCAHELIGSRPTRRICPLCRGRIETVMNVFI